MPAGAEVVPADNALLAGETKPLHADNPNADTINMEVRIRALIEPKGFAPFWSGLFFVQLEESFGTTVRARGQKSQLAGSTVVVQQPHCKSK